MRAWCGGRRRMSMFRWTAGAAAARSRGGAVGVCDGRGIGPRAAGCSFLLAHFVQQFGELLVDVVPLAHACVGQKPGGTGTPEFVAGEVFCLLVIPRPELQIGEKVGVLIAEFQVGGVGGLLFVER